MPRKKNDIDDELVEQTEDLQTDDSGEAADTHETDKDPATNEQDANSTEEKELRKAIKNFVEDEDDLGDISFKTILGGDLLQSRFFRRQVLFVVFVAALILIYTGNRYSSQQDIITIDSLKVRLQQERYNVLTQSSELLNLSRQSNIEKQLRLMGDSALANPTTPPFEIEVKK